LLSYIFLFSRNELFVILLLLLLLLLLLFTGENHYGL
jgi:hypothetical protein